MDFFSSQDRARSITRRLALLFTLAVLATVVAVNILTYVVVSGYIEQQRSSRPSRIEAEQTYSTSPWMSDLHLKSQVAVTLITLAIITFGSLFKTAQLRGGGPTVATSLGGRPARPDSDARERQLVNIVEEMSLASGVAMPQVYVLDQEEGINAFAAGLGQHDAVVAVTAGALKQFTRDELQGVIGHEFSHILNGDMRINLRLIGLLHGILIIALTGRLVLRLTMHSGRSRSSKDDKSAIPLFVIGFSLLIIGSIGHLFGQLIKAAISRQREYLADAAAVQFTRNPNGIASALKKLGAGSSRSLVAHERTAEASHLFFGNAVTASWFGGFATHPPLAERIRAIDPSWTGNFPPALLVDEPEPPSAPTPTRSHHRQRLDADSVVARIGQVSPTHVAFGAAMLASIPTAISTAAHNSFSARAVIIALLFGVDRAKAVPLQDLLERSGDTALAREVRRLHGPIAALGHASRLPLLDICFPALSQLSDSQRPPFLELLNRLAKADGVLDPAEYCLTRLVAIHLRTPSRHMASVHAIKPLLPSLSVLLSALVYFGHTNKDAQRTAFAAGAAKLVESDATLDLVNMSNCGPDALDAALDRLLLAAPGIKRRILSACAHAIAADGTVEPREAELIRVIGMMLDTPIPPFADQLAAA